MKIAVIRFSALGDLASMYPILKSLKYQPTIITTNIGKLYYEDEFENIICLKSKSIINVIKLIIKLRKEKFDAVFDFQCNDRSRFITKFLKTKIFDNKDIDVYNNSTFNIFKSIANKSGLLENININFNKREKNYIVFNCGSSEKWKSKRLPTEKWIEFSKIISSKYSLPIYLIGDKTEIEYINNISKELHGNIKNLVGTTSIKELKTILKNAYLTISTDSAAMHISAVSGTPTIGIFGATNWIRSAPYGEWSTVIYDKSFFSNNKPLKANTMEINDKMYYKLNINDGLNKINEYL